MPKKSKDSIYRLKVTLRGSKPPIWRRLLVPDSITLYKLHDIIQVAMGWTDSHLHQFIIENEYYGIPHPDDWRPVIDERNYRLKKVTQSEGFQFIYEYDFGDSWEHQILLEKIQPPEPGIEYPICTKGKRACPPEDVGGVWGYSDFLEAINDPDHTEHDSYIEWVGGEFDAEKFNIEEINEALH